jgi:hypothetical protein
MPIHSLASYLSDAVEVSTVVSVVVGVAGLFAVNRWAAGRKNTWERDWAGKMILVVVSSP